MLEKIVSFCLFAISLLAPDTMQAVTDIPKRCFNAKLTGGAVQVVNDRLYAAGQGKIVVYSLKDPKNPEFISSCKVPASRQMCVQGDRLYLTARNWGLWIFDVSNPQKIRKVRHVATAELATGLEVYGDLLLVGERNYGTEVFDLRDKDNPRSLGFFKTPEAQSVIMAGKYCYTGDWRTNSVTITDLADPARPVVTGEIFTEGYTDGVCIQNGLLYVATGHHNLRPEGKFIKIDNDDVKHPYYGTGHGLEIFDLKNPVKPEFLGRVKFNKFYDANCDYWKVLVSGNTACVVDTFNGFYTVDVSNPRKPVVTGHTMLPEVDHPPFVSKHNRQKFPKYADCAKDVAIGDGVAYVAGLKTGLWVMECPGVKPVSRAIPENAATKRKITPAKLPANFIQTAEKGHVYRLAVQGDVVYAACANEGIRVYRIAGNELKLIQKIATVSGIARCCYDVLPCNGKLYAACGEYLMIFDIKEDGKLKKVLKPVKKKNIQFQVLHIYGKRLAVSCGASGVALYDLNDKGVPAYAGLLRTRYHLYSDYLSDGAINDEYLFHNTKFGIYRCKVTECESKVCEDFDSRVRARMASGITVCQKYFVTSNGKQIFFFDPAGDKVITVNSPAVGVPSCFDNRILVFAQRIYSDIYTLQVKDVQHPELLKNRSFNIPGAIPGKIQFHKGRMLIPTWKYGIILEKLPLEN